MLRAVMETSGIDSIRRRLKPVLTSCEQRRHLTTARVSPLGGEGAPPLEAFTFPPTECRDRHFWATVRVGDRVVAEVVSRCGDSSAAVVNARLIRTDDRLLYDLKVNALVDDRTAGPTGLDPKDVVVVAVTDVSPDKRLKCQFVAKTDFNYQSLNRFSNISFNNYVKNLPQFRNSFALRDKTFSTLLFNKCLQMKDKRKEPEEEDREEGEVVEEKEREAKRSRKSRRSSSSSTSSDSDSSSSSSTASSSSTSTLSTTSSSSDDRRRRRRHRKKRKHKTKAKKKSREKTSSSKKISFVVKKSVKSAPKLSPKIPGFEKQRDRGDGRKDYKLSDKMRKQLKRDEEIERRIQEMASKTVHKLNK